AVQHRMAYQGEYFIDRYGKAAAERTPPIRRMLEMGIPVGAGTDATRVASYNPFVSLYWLIAGKTVGGTVLYSEANCLERTEALRLYTLGSSWFSGEQGTKGAIAPGQLGDLAVLTDDFFSIPHEEIKALESVLTIVGGKVVYAAGEFQNMDPPALPVMPDWSPVIKYGGYGAPAHQAAAANHAHAHSHHHACGELHRPRGLDALLDPSGGFFGLGCDCFAF
ncbi:MAG: amidohydrolase family protein, partial [Verrucomicrobiota bacterium]|nr:amidohydrolase family protein [Verrucomicrobiota bacterium]